jgi:hypothetical protein
MPGSSNASGIGENIEGIAVTGKGTIAAKPDRFEIELEVSAASELTADAIVKYRDAKKRLQEAYAALKMDNVTVEEKGLLVDQKGQSFNPYIFDMMPSRKGKTEVQLTRKLVVTCKGIRGLDEEAVLQLVAKLLDVAQDSGGKVGGGNEFNPYFYDFNRAPRAGLVRFVLDDFDALEEKAYEQAVADAQARARRLAKLNGVALGRVAAVREVETPSDRRAGSDEPEVRKRLESPRFQEVPVRVTLMVRFDVKAENQTGARATAP